MIARHTVALHASKSPPDNILITSGSQQALDFVGRLFINRGDYIVVESPTYLGALQAWNAYGAQYIPVRTDENGMIVDELEAALRIGPKFIYVLPNFQNPSGVDAQPRAAQEADRAGRPVRRPDRRRRSVWSAALSKASTSPRSSRWTANSAARTAACYSGNVIYLSTFSKLLAPGLRLAWVIAPPSRSSANWS